MTMVSFRLDDAEAEALNEWAERLDVDRSQLLRDAVHRRIVQLAAEYEADRWAAAPLTGAELALGVIADWGPAEDWSDWSDASG